MAAGQGRGRAAAAICGSSAIAPSGVVSLMSLIRLAVLYGGRSSEHDVSLMSATNVLGALDPAQYDVVPIFITRAGRWIQADFVDGKPTTPETGIELALVPGGGGAWLARDADGVFHNLPPIDALLPVLHGLGGEDGAVQGLAEVAGVALIGCGILGSAAALDKDIAKRLLAAAGIPVARAVTLTAATERPSWDAVTRALGSPVFVKPARQGSSVGVSKATDVASFAAALDLGFAHDAKLLAEEFIAGREIECAVLEEVTGGLFVSRPGEIAPAASHGFYSYDAKYVDAAGADIRVPAELPVETEARLRDLAARAFRALGCDGMARVDFFLTESGTALVNEVNTIPGFTDISMYPKAMAASGVPTPELMDKLIAHGLKRAGR